MHHNLVIVQQLPQLRLPQPEKINPNARVG